jgi:NADH dehydrogenase
VSGANAGGPRRVVLLGGGYVTLHAYAGLVRHAGRAVRRGDIEVVVLSADHSHSFHGFTGEALAGLLPYERTRERLDGLMPHARVVLGRAVAIDAEQRVGHYEPPDGDATRALGFDALVVGTGGREPAHTVPGLAEHGFTLRSPGDIERLVARVEAAAASVDGRPHHVVVAGAGLAGVEIAAAVADRGGPRIRVDLVHRGESILPALRAEQPRLARCAETELERLGVRTRLGSRIVSVSADHVHLADGSGLPADSVIVTIGQRPVEVLGLDAHRDPRGRLVTLPDLSVVEGVWAAGDAACVLHPTTGRPVPANALWAIKAGAVAGTNVARHLTGRRTRAFRYRGLGQAASFGLGRSISELYGVPFTGWVAWALRMAFFLRFMPSRRTALRVVGDLLPGGGVRRIASAGNDRGSTVSAWG